MERREDTEVEITIWEATKVHNTTDLVTVLPETMAPDITEKAAIPAREVMEAGEVAVMVPADTAQAVIMAVAQITVPADMVPREVMVLREIMVEEDTDQAVTPVPKWDREAVTHLWEIMEEVAW